MKICYKCKESKSMDMFSKNVTRPDKKQSECKSCKIIYCRMYRDKLRKINI